MTPNKIGILLTNIGTPAQPTTDAVRQYLKKFLSDPRVVEFPRALWWPILHGIILRRRPKRSALLYQKIWTNDGSPLLIYSKNIAEKLQHQLQIPVALGMHYSSPDIENALEKLRALQVKKIIILPLYPQYSGTTTASTFDFVSRVFKKWRNIPEIVTIHQYADNINYLNLLASSIRDAWETKGQPEHLLFSFHGIPERYAKRGDPYPDLCKQTSDAVASLLALPKNTWSISFQSRIGFGWLKPYTEPVLSSLPQKGISHLHVICPGFATDCLETLEEINIRGKKQFISAGGKEFHYIPALNDTNGHIDMLKKIISSTFHPSH